MIVLALAALFILFIIWRELYLLRTGRHVLFPKRPLKPKRKL